MKIHDFAATIVGNPAFEELFQRIEASQVARLLSSKTAEDREQVYQRIMAVRDIRMSITNIAHEGELEES